MAFYKLIGPKSLKLSDGTRIGFGVYDGSVFANKELYKGQGSITLKEYYEDGRPAPSKDISFSFGEQIILPNTETATYLVSNGDTYLLSSGDTYQVKG